MENYKINHELNQYDYAEGIEFKGLMPALMEVEGVKTIGANPNASDYLEVIDINAIMEDSDEEEPVGPTGPTGNVGPTGSEGPTGTEGPTGKMP